MEKLSHIVSYYLYIFLKKDTGTYLGFEHGGGTHVKNFWRGTHVKKLAPQGKKLAKNGRAA